MNRKGSRKMREEATQKRGQREMRKSNK